MPFGGNDWLALTSEPTLEPEIPICDPHHHFWDFRTARIPHQRYLLHELASDINSGHNVRSTVFVEARSMYRTQGPEEMRPVGEVEFVQGMAAASAAGLYGPGRAAAWGSAHGSNHGLLIPYRQYVAFAHDHIFVRPEFNLRSGVLAVDHLVPDLDAQFAALPVVE